MDHLALDDVIAFVSLTEMNEETMQWITAVNTHIADCRECRELVRSFQLVYDETMRLDLTEDADLAIAAEPEKEMAAFSAFDADDLQTN